MEPNSIEHKTQIATKTVHDVALNCAKQIHEAVKSLDGFDDNEKFLTQQRIVNRIYVAFNTISFDVATKVAEAGDL